jgi:hypothetical protein
VSDNKRGESDGCFVLTAPTLFREDSASGHVPFGLFPNSYRERAAPIFRIMPRSDDPDAGALPGTRKSALPLDGRYQAAANPIKTWASGAIRE